MALHPTPGGAVNPLPGGAEVVQIPPQGCSNATGVKTLALQRGAWELQPASQRGWYGGQGGQECVIAEYSVCQQFGVCLM